MKLLRIILMTVASYLSFAAIAHSVENFTLSKSYWVDETGKANFEEARHAKYRTFDGSVSEGYSDATLWLKVRVAGRADGKPLAIVVKPAFLRNLALYDPDLQGYKADPVISGRDAALTEGTYIGLDNGFVIPSTIKSRDVFLRIRTTTTLTVEVSVLPYDIAVRNSQTIGVLLATYFAFILGFCLWGLVNWGVRRDSLYGLYALRQFYSLLHIFVFFGGLRFFFGNVINAEMRENIYTFITVTMMLAAGHFDVRLISDFGGAPWLRRIIRWLLFAPILGLTLVAFGQTQTALELTAIAINVMMVGMVAFAFTAKDQPDQPYGASLLWFLRLGFLGMAAVIVVPILMYQNILQSKVSLFSILFSHAVISTIILFAILSIRGRRQDMMAQETRLQLQVQEAEFRKETGRRVEKERFLSMLTHELRNPLSVIRLLGGTDSGGPVVQKAAQDMAEVIERVEQSEKIDAGEIHLEQSQFDAATVVRQIADAHPEADRLQLDLAARGVIFNDRELFRRIVGNLVDNAAKYSAEGSVIRVQLAEDSADGIDGLRLSVSNAIGEAGAPDPERLFTKYYRSKRAHRRPGSGLGLFLVASWGKAMGGTVGYALGGAADTAQFSVWLPR